jgi:hypothetical protein
LGAAQAAEVAAPGWASAVGDRRGRRLDLVGSLRPICILAKTLSFFELSGGRRIDFRQFDPMFRLDAARYRNAIF